MTEEREMEIAGTMREMLSLGWTKETLDSDFDSCESDEWVESEKKDCRRIFNYIWDDVQDEIRRENK